MDLQRMIRGRECACGRTHKCAIRDIAIARGALERLPGLTESYSRILLVADENTYRAAGERAAGLLGERILHKVLFSGDTLVIPNEESVGRVNEKLGNADLILGVGSGVIQDLCKYVSKTSGIPYMIVATAPSMDGYASDGAAMIMGGMKVTYPTGLPLAIVADPEVMASAPMDMIRAGYGDIVGKYSALCDWKLSAVVNGEYFCPEVYQQTLDIVEAVVAASDRIMRCEPDAIAQLTEALIAVGILMSYVGNSRPASGSEHHLSHYFEITGILSGRSYLAHGIDVAYATVLTAEVREAILAADWTRRVPHCLDEADRREIRRIYGQIAEECIALQEEAGSYRKPRAAIYLEKEKEIRSVLSAMPGAAEIRRILAAAGFDMESFFAYYTRPVIADGMRYAKELKNRYTVLWMAYDLGIYPEI
ncbi:MAG: sn-glycerol-1-phosphate dehydrogenase [Clostridia bacterium]|nr:sn-glycerol-1-phosphate dehydrogenase [Clostridia bacterium]